MTVTLSQESYDAMLDDLKKLRERNVELERKARLFDNYISEVKQRIKFTTRTDEEVENEVENIINDLEGNNND